MRTPVPALVASALLAASVGGCSKKDSSDTESTEPDPATVTSQDQPADDDASGGGDGGAIDGAADGHEDDKDTDTKGVDEIAEGAVAGVAIIGPADGFASANTCIELKLDASGIDGKPVRADEDVAIALDDTSAHEGAFYGDSACDQPLALSLALLEHGNAETSVYYWSKYPAAVSVTAAASGVTVQGWTSTLLPQRIANLTVNYDASSAAPDGSGDLPTNTCIGPLSLDVLDAHGYPTISSMTNNQVGDVIYDSGDAGIYVTSACDTDPVFWAPLGNWDIAMTTDVSGEFYLKGSAESVIHFDAAGTGASVGMTFTFH
jgi:hypothetical protein